MRRNIHVAAGLAALVLLTPGAAQAYIGPGAGLAAIGTVLALVGAVLLAIVGFVWYPVKRLRAKRREKRNRGKDDGAAAA